MKNLLLLSLLVSVVFTAQASETAIETLPRLFNAQLIVNPGPEFAAVQPTAHVKFTYASCARFQFLAEIEETEKVMLVKMVPVNRIDCRALPIKRTYNVQVSSDYGFGAKPIVILNPLGQDHPSFREE